MTENQNRGIAMTFETKPVQRKYPDSARQPGNGLAITGMVCGIVGVLLFNIILGPLAIIFGGVGCSRANRGARYKAMAIAPASEHGASVYFHAA